MAKLIVVTGATGAQGGSVVDALLKDPSKWKVRAVTRNTTSDAAKKLAEKGVEVVKCDLGNKFTICNDLTDASLGMRLSKHSRVHMESLQLRTSGILKSFLKTFHWKKSKELTSLMQQ